MADRVNIAISGGQCQGKSTLAASLFSSLRIQGRNFDLIGEEKRKLKSEFGNYQSPFERLYIWRQQNREELRSLKVEGVEGFITDTPLFHLYVDARMHAETPRDNLPVRELFRMCMEIEDRYQIIAIARHPWEIPFQKDGYREAGENEAYHKHRIIRSFLEHFWPGKLLYLSGNLDQRRGQIEDKIKQLGA